MTTPNNQETRPHWRAASTVQKHARELRKTMTPAESKLWHRLRHRKLDGAHFRRQHAVCRFIVDFFCAKAKLVIEIDSTSHLGQGAYDAERT